MICEELSSTVNSDVCLPRFLYLYLSIYLYPLTHLSIYGISKLEVDLEVENKLMITL